MLCFCLKVFKIKQKLNSIIKVLNIRRNIKLYLAVTDSVNTPGLVIKQNFLSFIFC